MAWRNSWNKATPRKHYCSPRDLIEGRNDTGLALRVVSFSIMPVKKSHSVCPHPDPVFEDDIDIDVPHSPLHSPPSSPPPSQPIKTTATPSESSLTPLRSRGHPQRSPLPMPVPVPDPTTDITRLRVRAQRHHCLYPGATFQGTQKSGRNSYDVNVTIVVRLACVTHLSCTHGLVASRTSTFLPPSFAGTSVYAV